MPLWWLDTGDCSLRQGGAGVLGGYTTDRWMVIGSCPSDSDGLTFVRCTVDDSLSWGLFGSGCLGKVFWVFWVFR